MPALSRLNLLKPNSALFDLSPTVLATALTMAFAFPADGLAQAASPMPDEPRLKTSPQLNPSVSPSDRRHEPVFLTGQEAHGRTELETVVEGSAQLRKRSIVIKADRLEYHQPTDTAKARGHVRILRDGNLFTGTELELKVDAFEGYFLNPEYQLLRSNGAGSAERLDFLDEKRSVAKNATFTTCRDPGTLVGWMPDWVLQASKISFDHEEEVGYAENGQLRFKDVPILATPALSFPLTEKRKSGVLPPTINVDNISGLDLTLPYYWDLAPNRDFTLSPNIKSKRGLNMGGEFRYLEAAYQGEIKANVMPSDLLRHQDRWGLSARHSGLLTPEFLGHAPIGLNIALNRVSDDNYWRDFPRGSSSLTQRLLSNDVTMNWQSGDVRAQFRTLKWQTLQDTSAPITPPYDKLPNLNVRYDSTQSWLNLSLEGDYSKFESNSGLTGQPNAQRAVGIVRLSAPLRSSGYFIVPKVQIHQAQYQFDTPVTLAGAFTGQTSTSRSIPTYSLDAGLIFERPTKLLDRELVQTLEPRAFWTKTPWRNQSGLPVYDTAARDFNFSSIWNENEYVGHDRISASHTLTLGASSRYIDPTTGSEAVRLSAAQRLRFSDQTATLPGETPATAKVSDLLFGLGLNWNPKWQVDSTIQYSPQDNRSVRNTLLARYSPGPYRVISMAYRLNRGASEQIDLGWQWPIDDLWRRAADDLSTIGSGLGAGRVYTVGRLNYSVFDRKVVDAIIGVEYDSGCWLSRVVLERMQRSDATANSRLMFQLEFVGFSRVGTNPTETLRTQVPGYQFLRDKSVVTPNRLTTYE